MRRGLGPEEVGLWTVVTATVRPIPSRLPRPVAPPIAAATPAQPPPPPKPASRPRKSAAPPPASKPASVVGTDLYGIEPGRRRRIVRGRDEIAGRLDLHGLDQDRARATLIGVLQRAQAEGAGAVLGSTGKGAGGQGVLRRRVPEWLGDPALRAVVAGLSSAELRHGGDGALYIALKRLAR